MIGDKAGEVDEFKAPYSFQDIVAPDDNILAYRKRGREREPPTKFNPPPQLIGSGL